MQTSTSTTRIRSLSLLLLSTTAALSLAACSADPDPAPTEESTHSASTTTPSAPAPTTATQPAVPPVPGGLNANEKSKLDTSDRVDVSEIEDLQAEETHPGLPKQAAEVGLDPAHWANADTVGYQLRLSTLPWAVPQATGTTVDLYAPVGPEALAAEKEDDKKRQVGKPDLFLRLESAGLVPDLNGVPLPPPDDYDVLHGDVPTTTTLTACAPGTSMSVSDQQKVKALFGPAAVSMPASEWTPGGVAVALPPTWEVRDLLPCYPMADKS